MFSSRLDWTVRPNPLSELLAHKRALGTPVLDLTESNPTHAGIQYPEAEIVRAFSQEALLRYEPEPFGLPQAREAVAAYYAASGLTVDPSHILLTASTSEAYAYLFKLFAAPGDEILTPRPSYPLFEYLAHLESVRVIQYPLFYDHGWHIDMAALESRITARTRAIVVVNPNNPTGSYLKTHEFYQLIALARKHDLAIVSDEVFSDHAFAADSTRVNVAAAQSEVLAFSLSGLSKIVGLPQMKLGWMLAGGPAEQRTAALSALELIADTYLSVGTPVQLAAGTLLAARLDIQRQIAGRIAGNLLGLQDSLRSAPHFRLLDIEGGWYATLQVPRIRTEEEWAMLLLHEHNVLVQPGFFYDFEAEAYLILSLLTPPAIFTEGIARVLSCA